MITIGMRVELIPVNIYRDMILTMEEDVGLISIYADKYNAFKAATGMTEGTVQSVDSNFVIFREMSNIKFPISTVTEIVKISNGGTDTMNPNSNGGVLGTMLTANTNAAKTAAKMTAGKIALKVAKEKLAPMLPIMVRGYLDTPFGDVLVANMLVVANKYTNGKYKVLGTAAEATTEAAYANLFESFKLDELLSEFESKLTKAGFTDTETE